MIVPSSIEVLYVYFKVNAVEYPEQADTLIALSMRLIQEARAQFNTLQAHLMEKVESSSNSASNHRTLMEVYSLPNEEASAHKAMNLLETWLQQRAQTFFADYPNVIRYVERFCSVSQ